MEEKRKKKERNDIGNLEFSKRKKERNSYD